MGNIQASEMTAVFANSTRFGIGYEEWERQTAHHMFHRQNRHILRLTPILSRCTIKKDVLYHSVFSIPTPSKH